jgi:hypothetical protein
VNLPLDQQIDAAHLAAERVENEARQIEARIIKAGGVPPKRPYGKPVSGEAVSRNITLTGALQRRDPALANYLGIGSDYHRKQEAAAEARKMQVQAMEMQTARLREVNAASSRYRQQQTSQVSIHLTAAVGGSDAEPTAPALWLAASATC